MGGRSGEGVGQRGGGRSKVGGKARGERGEEGCGEGQEVEGKGARVSRSRLSSGMEGKADFGGSRSRDG